MTTREKKVMKLDNVESIARKAAAQAQTAERKFAEAAQKATEVDKESRLARKKFKQAKKESKQAAKAARVARDAAKDARRVSDKAAARAAKAQAKVVKLHKKVAAGQAEEADTPKRAQPKPAGPAAVSVKRDRKAARQSRPKTAARSKRSGATEAPGMKSAFAKPTRAPAAKRIAASRKPAVRPATPAASESVGRPEPDFDVEWTDADLKEIDSLS